MQKKISLRNSLNLANKLKFVFFLHKMWLYQSIWTWCGNFLKMKLCTLFSPLKIVLGAEIVWIELILHLWVTLNRKKKKWSKKYHACQAATQTLIIFTLTSAHIFRKLFFENLFSQNYNHKCQSKERYIAHHKQWSEITFLVSWVHNFEIWKSGYFMNKRYSNEIIYKKTGEWCIEWQRMVTSDNE